VPSIGRYSRDLNQVPQVSIPENPWYEAVLKVDCETDSVGHD